MVQLIPQESLADMLGSQIGQGLGQGFQGGISNAIQSFNEQKKTRGALSGLEPLFKQAGIDFTPEDREAFVKSGLPPEIAANFAQNIFRSKEASRLKEQQLAEKQRIAQKEEQESLKKQEGLQNTFNELGNMVIENQPGIGISPGTKIGLNRKGVENRNKFNSLRTRIEGALVPLVNKGALSKERFKFILDNVPLASDSQRSIVGKLKGLGIALSEDGIPIDTSILEGFGEKAEKSAEPQSEVPTAVNPRTGQKLILKDGKWQVQR